MDEYKPSNRSKKTAPRLGKFWCSVCDGYEIWDGQRCPRCGHRDCSKHKRK